MLNANHAPRYGADTLEEAFFAATGRTFEDEQEDEKD